MRMRILWKKEPLRILRGTQMLRKGEANIKNTDIITTNIMIIIIIIRIRMDIKLLIPKIIKKLSVCVKANLFSIITECPRCLVLVSSYLVIFNIGTYGEVWNCVQRETGAHRAVKVIKRYKYIKQ